MQILEVSIQTDDLQKTEKFYSGVLGLQTKSKDQHSISFLAGRSTLSFINSHIKDPKYHLAFNIPSNKLDEAIGWISNKTDLINIAENEVIAHFENWNAKSIYFFDNKGNVLEFIVRFDLDNSSENPFDSDSILSINEIGVVTNEPLAFAETIIQDHGLEYFWRGPKREDFVAVGDDDGLIVIATPGRNWYPTESPSEVHYLRIWLETDGATKHIIVNGQNNVVNQ